MFQRRSLLLAWSAFILVVFGLFNSCATHRVQRQTGAYLAKGTWTVSAPLFVRVLRVLGTDDGDISRYQAYSRAMLGQSYQSYYIRPLDEWMKDTDAFDNGKDPDDPEQSPPVTPSRALTPYKDYLVEYPPGFFLFSLPPTLLTGDKGLDRYSFWFGTLMGVLLLSSLWLNIQVAKRVAPQLPSDRLVRFTAACLLVLGTISLRRYDAALSFSLSLLLFGCVTQRPILAGAALALGIVTKGMPILVAPLVVFYFLSMKRFRDLALATASGVLVGLLVGLPFALAAGRHLFDMFSYHGMRPLQVESTFAALLVLSHALFGTKLAIAHTYGSMNIVGTGEPLLRVFASILPLLSLLGVWLWSFVSFRRAPDQSARDRALTLSICLVLVGQMTLGKVFSPQYLTWLIPIGMLASLIQDQAGRWLLFATMALTFFIFPISYHLSLAGTMHPLFGSVLLVRNLCLLAWAVRLLLPSRSVVAMSIPSAEAA